MSSVVIVAGSFAPEEAAEDIPNANRANRLMFDSPVSAIDRGTLVSLPCCSVPSFSIRPGEPKGKKRRAVRLFKLQVPMEKMWPFYLGRRTCVRACVRACMHVSVHAGVHTDAGFPAADERPSNKRQRKNAGPRLAAA